MSDITSKSIAKLKKLKQTNDIIKNIDNNYKIKNKSSYEAIAKISHIPEGDVIEVLSQPKRRYKPEF